MSRCDEAFMELALAQAKQAYALGEVPVGAVIVHDGQVIGSGYNLRETGKNALAHAEVIAIDAACKALDGWRLEDCTLYVTLEPCPMCTGAIINARIKRVVYGVSDEKTGCMGSVANLCAYRLGHDVQITHGVLNNACTTLLKEFFSELRMK